jgi:hypothetical protein
MSTGKADLCVAGIVACPYWLTQLKPYWTHRQRES